MWVQISSKLRTVQQDFAKFNGLSRAPDFLRNRRRNATRFVRGHYVVAGKITVNLADHLHRSNTYSPLPPSCDGPPVSLRFGHVTALTVHRTVIHYRAAASLPTGEGIAFHKKQKNKRGKLQTYLFIFYKLTNSLKC